MNRYGIEDIGNAVKESTICPFMLERECSTLADNDCVRCVKGWFAEHNKQIRNEVISELRKQLDIKIDFGGLENRLLFFDNYDKIAEQLKEQDNE